MRKTMIKYPPIAIIKGKNINHTLILIHPASCAIPSIIVDQNPSFKKLTASISGGVLSFKSYKGAAAYHLIISDYYSTYLKYGKGKYAIESNIDWLIKAGYIDKKDTYRVTNLKQLLT